jgi:hypothetical protein
LKAASSNTATTPVVVELFTSEGCSSCPAADRVLQDLETQQKLQNAQLVLLGEHVDYWDHLGWHDRFSSAQFTNRQKMYAQTLRRDEVYTPQIVIDGKRELVGSETGEVKSAIVRAAGATKPTNVILDWQSKDRLKIVVQNAPQNATHILLAVTEGGLKTEVGGGENGGRVLQHAAVVRELRDLGPTSGGKYSGEYVVNWSPEWNRNNVKLVVVAQQADGTITGASSIPSL